MRNAYKILVQKHKWKRLLEDLDIARRVINIFWGSRV
jgi:hypothetical protein